MHHHQLHELRRLGLELDELVARLVIHLENQEYHMADLDLSAIAAAVSAINSLTASITATVSGDVSAAVAAQVAADQAAVTAAVTPLTAAIAALQAAVAPVSGGGTPTAALTVSPATVSQSAGTSFTTPLSFSGGTAPYTATDLPAGVTFDGSNLVGDGTEVAGTSTVTFTDSSSPALTATVAVTIS